MADTTYKNTRARRILIVILVFLVLLLVGVSAFVMTLLRPVGGGGGTTDDGMTWIRSIYGYGKEPDNQLTQPYGVAVAPDGTIWVTEGSKARVMGFNPDGSFNALLHQGPAGMSPNAFRGPSALAVAEDGEVYIVDGRKNVVTVSTPDNKLVEQINVQKPVSVAVRGDRVVVGADAGFAILDRDGNLIKQVGSKGKEDDQFDVVQGVAIAEDGTIYAVDRHNNRVSAYTPEGKRKWIRQTGVASNASANKGMSEENVAAANTTILPSGITIDGAGRLVIADAFDFELTVLDPKDGKVVGEYGLYGTADGEFVYPTSVAYDPERDWFAVADTYNDRVQIVRLPGSGGSPISFIRSTLEGPIKALLIPLLLLLLLIIAWVVSRYVRRRQEKARKAAALAASRQPA